MALNQVMATIYAVDNRPPASNPALPDQRNTRLILTFDDSVNQEAIFEKLFSDDYNGGGVDCIIGYSMATDEAGDIDWDIKLERIAVDDLDTDTDGWSATNSADTNTIPPTAGDIREVTIAFTDGTDMNDIAAGDYFRLSLVRDQANDTATGNAEMHYIKIVEK